MAEGWVMLMGTRKAVGALLLLALLALGVAGCGSEDETPTAPKPPPISAATANQLATLSEQVASDLDAGETCDAAIAADELKGAVEDADLSASLRPGVQEVVGRLVDEVNCPPPPPEPEPKKPKKEEKQKPKHDDEEHGGDEGEFGPGHSGGLPPGQAKIKGEAG